MSVFALMAGEKFEQLNGKIPGPDPSAPLGNAGAFLGANPWEPTVKFLKEYGDVVLIWMATSPAILLNDPKLLSELLVVADADWATDDRFYKDAPRPQLLPITTDTSCFINNGKEWAERRESHPFSAKEFSEWLKTQVQPVRRVVSEDLARLSGHDKPFDLREPMQRMCFDGFGAMLVGESLSDDMYEDFQVVSEQAQTRLTALVHLPTELSFRFQKAKEEWFAGISPYLTSARQNPAGNDMIRRFLPTTTMDDNSFRNEVANVFPAGVYSVTSSVMSALWQLVANPKLLKEAREAVLAMGDDWTWDDLQACKPLRWALLEAMRLYPGAPFFSRNVKTTGPIEFAGATLPANTTIYITPVALQRNKEHWGEDADEFRPGRWEQAEAKNAMGSDYYFPFGRGPRECLGKAFGLAYAQIALATCIGKWDWDINDRRQGEGFYFACMVHEGLKATVKPIR